MELNDFNNVHQGERVFILGNGPSLQQTPLDKLNNEYTIGLNQISKVYNSTGWRPTYYVFHDAVHESGNEYGINGITKNLDKDLIGSVRQTVKLGIPCFLSEPGRKWFNRENNVLFYQPKTPDTETQKRVIRNRNIDSVWSTDITKYISAFASSITVAAQIATYMGFERLYFIGCDLYEPTINQRLIFPEANHPISFDFNRGTKLGRLVELLNDSESKLKTLTNTIYIRWIEKRLASLIGSKGFPFRSKYNSVNYVTEDYTSDTQRSSHSLNSQMRRAHKLIKLASEKHEFEVYNATVGGHLELYERVDLSDIL